MYTGVLAVMRRGKGGSVWTGVLSVMRPGKGGSVWTGTRCAVSDETW